jgi:hypothetical protein
VLAAARLLPRNSVGTTGTSAAAADVWLLVCFWRTFMPRTVTRHSGIPKLVPSAPFCSSRIARYSTFQASGASDDVSTKYHHAVPSLLPSTAPPMRNFTTLFLTK